MKAKKLVPYLLIIAIVLIGASFVFPKYYFTKPPECIASNQIFGELDIESKEYQMQLNKLLSATTPVDFRYFFVTFSGSDQEFMVLNFRNESQCFDVKLLAPHTEELKGMRRTNGMSYPNELFDVRWRLQESNGISQVVFTDMHFIIE